MNKERSLSEELVDIDKSLTRLILERARMLSKAATARKNKRIALADPKQEKRLWAVWRQELYDRFDNPALVRELFFQLNALSYIQSEQGASEVYSLNPCLRPLQADLAGPRDSFYFRIQLVLAALSPGKTRLYNNPQAESVQDLINALNKWKGAVSREGTDLVVDGSSVLQVEEESAFVGSDPFTFYFLLCLALLQPCQIRFVGSAHLRRLRIQKLCAFLPQLGARLTPVEPAGFSLPARLESSGILPSELSLPADLPQDFLVTLLLVASLFPKGLRLTIPSELRRQRKIVTTLDLLKKFGLVPKEEGETGICLTFVPARPQAPAPELDSPLDTLFSASLLMLPLGAGGIFCLRGNWPEDEEAEKRLALLEQAGVQISHTSGTLVASRQLKDQVSFHLRPGTDMEIFPLLLASCLLGQKQGEIFCDQQSDFFSQGLELLDFLGTEYEIEEGKLRLPPQRLELPEKNWVSPHPVWTLAFALLAFACPGLRLNNPGQLLADWPVFWNIFNSLPRPVLEKRKIKEVEKDHGKKGKRIRLD